jgi:hypothetical protein
LLNPSILLGAGLMALLGLLAVAVILELGVEATSRLAAWAELGRDTALGEAFGQAFRRLPVFFIATLVFGVVPWLLSSLLLVLPEVISGGAGIVLLVLGIWVGVRFSLVPAAIVVGSAGPIEAFTRSWQLTQGNWWRVLFVNLLAVLGIVALSLVLMFIPIVGWFAAGWLAFAGMTTVLTLAYVRLGGGGPRRSRMFAHFASRELGEQTKLKRSEVAQMVRNRNRANRPGATLESTNENSIMISKEGSR